MSKTLSLLLTSAALSAVAGLPAWSAMHAASTGAAALAPRDAIYGSADASKLLVLIDDDEDEDDDEGGSVARSRSEDDDDDEDCDDDEGSCGVAAAPAPAGSVAPPQNGLFGTGTPQVKVK